MQFDLLSERQNCRSLPNFGPNRPMKKTLDSYYEAKHKTRLIVVICKKVDGRTFLFYLLSEERQNLNLVQAETTRDADELPRSNPSRKRAHRKLQTVKRTSAEVQQKALSHHGPRSVKQEKAKNSKTKDLL
ncbi:hypothetical protein AVEN_103399-1 [Araneus ventricosus]|uniref:Uncharacterized protein n=1 Tax=Araneus ventricosus TaxID=182803 RepID=A0A4Y2K1F2_ARAVE|nr:hypothetical protein AVEN_103399-1 [Araneus ventricosus]